MKFLNLDQFLQMLNRTKEEADYQAWPQIAVLTAEEKLKHKAMLNEHYATAREIELLLKKAANLSGQIDVAKDEFWHNLYRSHGLPPTGNYHIAEDGRILMEPKK